jgi:hypothetical protein
MVINNGVDKFTNLSFCNVKNENLEESVKLCNHLELKFIFENPLSLNAMLVYNNLTEESNLHLTSLDSDVKSEEIKEYLISFMN